MSSNKTLKNRQKTKVRKYEKDIKKYVKIEGRK